MNRSKLPLLTISTIIGVLFFMLNFFLLPTTNAQKKPSSPATIYNVQYENPISANSITEFIGNFLSKVQGMIGWLAVIMIVVGGIVYIASAGKTEQIELGKKIITFALIGFILAVAAPSILKEIVELARSGEGSNTSDVINQAKPFRVILLNILRWITNIFGLLAIISFFVSGFLFLFSAGETTRADNARKGLIYSIIGVAVAGGALIVIKQLLVIFGMQF